MFLNVESKLLLTVFSFVSLVNKVWCESKTDRKSSQKKGRQKPDVYMKDTYKQPHFVNRKKKMGSFSAKLRNFSAASKLQYSESWSNRYHLNAFMQQLALKTTNLKSPLLHYTFTCAVILPQLNFQFLHTTFKKYGHYKCHFK